MATLVEIVSYDDAWPNSFLEVVETLRRLLGSSILAIDHVGSTAVPGLCAKPVIDVDVTLRDLTDIPAASAILMAATYEPRGNHYDDEMWAFLKRSPVPQQRVYLCPPNNGTHKRRLLFRDFLRDNRDVARAYGSLKRNLSKEFAYDGDRYTRAKSQFIDAMVRRAQASQCSQP